MEVILKEDIEKLGHRGDVVKVADGYGRNYLLPRQLAIVASKGAEKQVQTIRRAQQARAVRGLDHANEIKQAIEKVDPVKLKAKAASGSGKLFGSVTTTDVVSAVKAAGGPVLDKRSIELPGHIKTVGKHQVNVRLHPDVTVSFKLDVTGN